MDNIQGLNKQNSPKVWYALRTFNCQELKISAFLKKRGKTHFIPMTYTEKESREGKIKRVLTPVVHNLIFLQKDQSQKSTLQMLRECTIPLNVLRQDQSTKYYEIPESQMMEFRILCDPDFEAAQFLSYEEAEAKPGKIVRIIHGPFTGITGKLHRVKNNFFFIKTLADVGVMMRISRWYCEVIQ